MELQLANTVSNVLVFLFKSLYGDIESFFSRVQFFLQSFPMIFTAKWNHHCRIPNTNCDGHEPLLHKIPCTSQTFEGHQGRILSVAEMNMVMTRLGMACRFEGINENASVGAQEFESLFEEEEPSLEEIKETFEVFDANNDGFIDASELHRVVCNFESKERFELEECEKMIKAFDRNGDGLIDFQEFVKFMEKCLD